MSLDIGSEKEKVAQEQNVSGVTKCIYHLYSRSVHIRIFTLVIHLLMSLDPKVTLDFFVL